MRRTSVMVLSSVTTRSCRLSSMFLCKRASSIEWAQEREMNERVAFITHAAQAIACLEKWKERASVPGDWWYWAYQQALGEFGCCIFSTVRSKEIFPGMFCDGCDEYLNDCRCNRLCECGVRVAKWGWSDIGGTCECTPLDATQAARG